MFPFIFLNSSRVARLLRLPPRAPLLVSLLGTLVSADYIKPRPTSKRVTCGHLSMEEPGWSAPFWSTTILLEDGTYVSVDLDPLYEPPCPGQPMSMVGRRRSGQSLEVVLMLRPGVRLANS